MARSGERVERERSPAEVRRMKVFDEFAERGLRRNGRCHLVDVRAALKADAEARAAGQASDAELRQAIKRFAPRARRSPNGFYRGLSVRTPPGSERAQR